MKNSLKNALGSPLGVALLGLLAATPAAHAAGPASDLYVGGGISFSHASGLGGKIDNGLASQGLGSSSSADTSSTNPNLRLGYRLSPNFAVEASYDRVGSMDVQSGITSPTSDTAAGSWKSYGLGLHALGIAPLDDKWSVYGRLGVERWHTRLNLASTAGGATSVSTSSNNTSLVLGAGASYALTHNLDATAELVHFTRVGSDATTGRTGLNQFNVGLRYHFL